MSVQGRDVQSEPPESSGYEPFGKYLLLERVAVGGMAEVFLAKSFGIEGFERILAVKRITRAMAEDESFIQMFIDEAKIAGHLTHANIAGIYELGKVGKAHYIAMEYVWGKDVLQIMNRHRLHGQRMPAARVAFIAARMCEALDYAHHKRDVRGKPLDLIHRDVSPQNVLVSYDGQVKLIDFGIARAQSRTTQTVAGFVKGKFGYMSPEQVRGKKIDARTDLFAVGICMYEMLTCERLFSGETDFETMDMIRQGKFKRLAEALPTVPLELERIVMKALAMNADDRFQTAAEMHQALMTWLMGQRPPFTAARLADWMQTAFDEEMGREKARLDAYNGVGRDVMRQSAPPSSARSGSFRALDEDEKTEVDDRENLLASDSEEWFNVPTQVFFSSTEREREERDAAAERPFQPDAEDAATSPGTIPAVDAGPGRIWPSEQPERWAREATDKTSTSESRRAAPLPATLPPLAPTPTLQMRAFLHTTRGRVIAAVAFLALAFGAYRLVRGPDTGTLHVIAAPAGATTAVDGTAQGNAPLHLENVAPGTHVVEVTAAGYRSARHDVVVEAGGSATIHVELAREAP